MEEQIYLIQIYVWPEVTQILFKNFLTYLVKKFNKKNLSHTMKIIIDYRLKG